MKYKKFQSIDNVYEFFSSNQHIPYITEFTFEANSEIRLEEDEEACSYRTSYARNELDRIQRLQQYIEGKRESGYCYTFTENGNGDILCNVDLGIPLTKNHPAFIKEFTESKVPESFRSQWFDLWKDQTLKPSLNGLFKLAYSHKLSEMVPDKIKLLDVIRPEKFKGNVYHQPILLTKEHGIGGKNGKRK